LVKPASLALQFNAIDTQEGTAEMPGINQLGSGAPHIIVRLVEGNLHFLAMNSTGSMYITTVFSDRESRNTGKWKAVHTRHEFTEVQLSSFTSRPEQVLRILLNSRVVSRIYSALIFGTKGVARETLSRILSVAAAILAGLLPLSQPSSPPRSHQGPGPAAGALRGAPAAAGPRIN
jgi:hypothetical protein